MFCSTVILWGSGGGAPGSVRVTPSRPEPDDTHKVLTVTRARYAVGRMSGFVLRGLLTEDGELDYSQHWKYGFHEGDFLAGLFDDVVDGEWWKGGLLHLPWRVRTGAELTAS